MPRGASLSAFSGSSMCASPYVNRVASERIFAWIVVAFDSRAASAAGDDASGTGGNSAYFSARPPTRAGIAYTKPNVETTSTCRAGGHAVGKGACVCRTRFGRDVRAVASRVPSQMHRAVVEKVASKAVHEEEAARTGHQVADGEAHLEWHIRDLARLRIHLVLGPGEVHDGLGCAPNEARLARHGRARGERRGRLPRARARKIARQDGRRQHFAARRLQESSG
eukprot:7318537-Prymnesium_polylepis.2